MEDNPAILYEPESESSLEQMKVVMEMLALMMEIRAKSLTKETLTTLKQFFDQGRLNEAMQYLIKMQILPSSS